jgi:sugar phosphate permease
MAAAARRLGILFTAITGGTAVLALLIGLAAGSSAGRALSVGWYIAGAVLLISGFFVGNRGPSRPQGEGWSVFSTRRWVRWATPSEQRESISFSALLVILGFVLIALAAFADPRYSVI